MDLSASYIRLYKFLIEMNMLTIDDVPEPYQTMIRSETDAPE